MKRGILVAALAAGRSCYNPSTNTYGRAGMACNPYTNRYHVGYERYSP
jgi:hypothetical protein